MRVCLGQRNNAFKQQCRKWFLRNACILRTQQHMPLVIIEKTLEKTIKRIGGLSVIYIPSQVLNESDAYECSSSELIMNQLGDENDDLTPLVVMAVLILLMVVLCVIKYIINNLYNT